MFKRLLFSSGQSSTKAATEETAAPQDGLSMPTLSGLARTEPPPNTTATKLPSFDEIYRKSTFKTSSTTADWHILKVADMLNSDHLRGLSPAAKHSALLMALEAADVAVEDILQDAVQRQRVLNDCEETQFRILEEGEKVRMRENERLTAEMESVCAQYRGRITTGMQEIEHARETFREWQSSKEREQRRIAEAASACVSGDAVSSDASITRLLEKNAGSATRFRESA
jgi:hypothetical protein